MQYSIKSITYKSANGTDTVSAVAVYPEETPVRAVVLISHGMIEHIGRYRAFMMFLASHGIAAFGHDHLGHGKTAPSPERLGYFAPENGYQCLLKDLHHLCRIAQSMFPEQKRFLFGHSMGSLVARLYCVKYPESISGAVFCGTPGPNALAGLGALLARRCIRREGEFSRPPLLLKMTIEDLNRGFTPTRTAKDWLSRDDEAVDRNLQDPLCNFVFTASAFLDLYAMLQIASARSWAQSFPKAMPVLMISGDCDPVGNFGRGVLQVYNMLTSAGVEDLSLQLYEGARHELLNELNRDEVEADILRWLEERI